MKEIKGKYNTAKVFTDNVEQTAIDQIKTLCDREEYIGSKIRIMPDVHAGAGCTIGTTMTIRDVVCPNLVGVDIGCGMLAILIKEKDINLNMFDEKIYESIPNGFNVHEKPVIDFDLSRLVCFSHVNIDRAEKSIGTLGGGNHFIEVNRDSSDGLWIVIHSGSRNLGKQVCDYYQDLAFTEMNNVDNSQIIEKCKLEGRERDIQRELKSVNKVVDKKLAYLTGQAAKDYLHDMAIVQRYAVHNRFIMSQILLKSCNLTYNDSIETIHNYIDIDNMILRKGAVSAEHGELLVIPMNMRDGSLLCRGKGNPDWNNSAPHGAGRVMSRRVAKESIKMSDFNDSMSNVVSTSVCESTLDEAPMAYKPMKDITSNMSETVDLIDILVPVYNFKSK
jgi:tRNA-splicing ligase RtcB